MNASLISLTQRMPPAVGLAAIKPLSVAGYYTAKRRTDAIIPY